ncbi:hypothetical protein [Sphingomonas sp. CL5.1]|uniref:hypothetical protein n=1 Tax=Sphingomonas sp. CL5.1 TaxID=2653203 RepID=UPI0015833AC7|nr:hypothetical protein [Sphingomonas sp. CL5.1]
MVLFGVCGWALLRGGRPERIGAVINLLASCVTTALRLIDAHFYAPAEVVVLAIDLGVAAGFFWLAIATIRFWPIWAFGFALANLFTNVVGPWIPRTPLFAYLTGLGIYAYLALGALLLGTLRLPRSAQAWLRRGMRRDLISNNRGSNSDCPSPPSTKNDLTLDVTIDAAGPGK